MSCLEGGTTQINQTKIVVVNAADIRNIDKRRSLNINVAFTNWTFRNRIIQICGNSFSLIERKVAGCIGEHM